MNLNVRNETKEVIVYSLVALLIISVFAFVLFGMTGVRVALGVFFVSLPFYLILYRFALSDGEKTVFSLLMGLTIFPSLVYIMGIVLSFRLSIFLTFVLLLSIGFFMIKYAPKHKEHSQ